MTLEHTEKEFRAGYSRHNLVIVIRMLSSFPCFAQDHPMGCPLSQARKRKISMCFPSHATPDFPFSPLCEYLAVTLHHVCNQLTLPSFLRFITSWVVTTIPLFSLLSNIKPHISISATLIHAIKEPERCRRLLSDIQISRLDMTMRDQSLPSTVYQTWIIFRYDDVYTYSLYSYIEILYKFYDWTGHVPLLKGNLTMRQEERGQRREHYVKMSNVRQGHAYVT